MNTDFHIHSSFSADSKSSMQKMISQGIKLGLKTMCFTEHMDFDLRSEGKSFEVDTASYHAELLRCQERFGPQIELLFGIELGLQEHITQKLELYVKQWDFDFIIGSSHVVNGLDPYYPSYFENRLEEECYMEYFESILRNLSAFSDMDVYGHLDYIVRYGHNRNKYYSYQKYHEILDEILKNLLKHNIGLEMNTAGYKYGLEASNPHPDIIKRYRELGGEIITVGSDGHAPEHLAYDFYRVKDLLMSCGFKYYTIFRNRKPEFIKL